MAHAKRIGRAAGWRFWLIGGYIVIALMLAIFWGFSLLTPIDQVEEDQQNQSLESIANAGSVMLANSDVSAQDAVDKLASSDSLRITLVGDDGRVLADSQDNADDTQSHAQRPEIVSALDGEVGRDRRVSETEGVEYLYVAVPANYQGQAAALRAATPVSQVDSLAQGFRTTSLIMLCVVIVLTAIVAFFVIRLTARPVGRLERVRTDFVANASHELKTPVAGIRLLSESIERASKDGDVDIIPVFTERLNKESQRLQNLVTELLDLSRLENGGLGGRNKETCDLASVVSTSYETHVGKARLKGLEFVYDDGVGSDELCRVNLPPADASLLVDNLLDNAINYTDTGTVEVSLSLSACSLMAATTLGLLWPTLHTPMPAKKSRYSLPSSSYRRAPAPRTNSTGLRTNVCMRYSESSSCCSFNDAPICYLLPMDWIDWSSLLAKLLTGASTKPGSMESS